MNKDYFEIYSELERLFENKPVSFIEKTLKETKFILFILQESTLFYMQFTLYMLPSILKLLISDSSFPDLFSCTISAILYYPIYMLFLRKRIFNNMYESYLKETEYRLKAIYSYIEARISETEGISGQGY